MDGTRTVLLTGAGGFIGRHLMREAAHQGNMDRWILTDLRKPNVWWGLPRFTEFSAGDLSDRAFCRSLFEENEITHVIHLAGWLGKECSDKNRDALISANLHSTVHLLDAICKGSSPHFLLPSTGLIYGIQDGIFHEGLQVKPQDDYAWSKHLAEETLRYYERNSKVCACIVRPSVIYGFGQAGEMFIPSLVNSLGQGKRFAMTLGEQKRDFLNVEDLARVLLSLSARDIVGTFNAGSGNSILLKDIARIVGDLMDCTNLLGIGDIPYRDREIWNYELDSMRIKEKIDWEPRIDIRDGIKKIIEWAEFDK